MESFASQDPRFHSLYFDLNILFRARKVAGTFEKRAPGLLTVADPETYVVETRIQTSILGWFSNKTGTLFDDGKARKND